jgi:hypothetical protein
VVAVFAEMGFETGVEDSLDVQVDCLGSGQKRAELSRRHIRQDLVKNLLWQRGRCHFGASRVLLTRSSSEVESQRRFCGAQGSRGG